MVICSLGERRYGPVISPACEGTNCGVVAYPSAKRTPSQAMASGWGAFTPGRTP